MLPSILEQIICAPITVTLETESLKPLMIYMG